MQVNSFFNFYMAYGQLWTIIVEIASPDVYHYLSTILIQGWTGAS